MDRLRRAVEGANLVICVIDGARADHVGCYGYPRPTTPSIDRLAEQSVVFERHFCEFPHTLPSTASLFTSQFPDTHMARGTRRLGRSIFTMDQGLADAGFHTAGFASSPWVSPTTGLGTRFERSHFRPTPPSVSRRPGLARHARMMGDAPGQQPESLLELVADWLAEPPRPPFFAYMHFLPPHRPYEAPEDMKQLFTGTDPPNARQGPLEFPQIGGHLPEKSTKAPHPLHEWVNLYDANLRWADWAIGEVERLLREAGVFDDTLFIVTSDHGEAFGEHGYMSHICGLYDESVHIPLVMRFPGGVRPVERVGALTQVVDLLPTLFDLLQVPYPEEQTQGRSLVPLLAGDVEKVRDYVFARDEGEPASYLVRSLNSALILYRGGELRALYDLESDPEQTRNVIEQQPDRAEELVLAFREFAETQRRQPVDFIDPGAEPAAVPMGPGIRFSEETRRELEALGYLD